MISFTALMFNRTEEEYIDQSPVTYTLGKYTGDSIIPGQSDGTVIENMPAADFQINTANNIGRAFEEHAKRYFLEHNTWPVLRLYKTTAKTAWIEWEHGSPNGFNIVTDSTLTFRWEHVFQWDDTIPTHEIGGETVLDVSRLLKSCVFLSTDDIEELTPENIVWSGSVIDSPSVAGTLDAYIGYAMLQIAVNDAGIALVTNGGQYLGMSGNRHFYKKVNGPAYGYFSLASDWWGPILFAPQLPNSTDKLLPPYNCVYLQDGSEPAINLNIGEYHGLQWAAAYNNQMPAGSVYEANLPIKQSGTLGLLALLRDTIANSNITVSFVSTNLYAYLKTESPGPGPGPEPPKPVPDEPDVDPDNPPDPDEPPAPIPPDNPDPYYDPTSDPDSPEYDPKKDPDSPEYDPEDPASPYRPPSTEGGGDPEVKPPVDPVTPPPTPPSHAINSRFVTLYTPSLSQLNDLAAYLWSPAWSIDGFKKIFANPMDCILGLMIFPALVSPSGSKEVNVGNLSTGVTMSYVDNQYVEVNCGSFEITEYYASYLDYDPYTKIEIYLPYIGTHRLSADDVMAKTIQLKYMIDLLSGACVAFLVVDGTTLYTFTGSCATPIPVSGNDWSNMVNGILSVAGAATAAVISGGTAATMAAGAAASTSLFVSSHKEHIRHGGSVASAAGLMSIQTPYLIVTRPRQALPIGQNSFQGYPSFITESLGSLSGYTEVESCHLEHIPCTAEELEEIERLLKGGVLF